MTTNERFDPLTYKSNDPYERLGLTRGRSITPSVVDSAYKMRMDWWHSMRHSPEWREHVESAMDNLAQARQRLTDPAGQAELHSEGSAAAQHNILMLGGPGAGKSALLGSIVDVCRDGALDPLVVTFTPGTRKNVMTNLGKLKEFCNPRVARTVKWIAREPNKGDTYTPYAMKVELRGKPRLQLNFIDTSGEDLATVMEEDSSLAHQIRRCNAAILVVDSVALYHQSALSQDGRLLREARRNMPENVEAAVQEWLRDEPESPRLLCIVPVKSETYLYDERTGRERSGARAQLITDTLKEFDSTISYLKQNRNCVIVVAPVETCGCLTLAPDWLDDPSGRDEPYPRELWDFLPDRIGARGAARYAPSHCEQPLAFILNFFLTLVETTEDPSGSQKVTVETLQIPPEWMDFAKKVVPNHVLQNVMETLDRFKYLVSFVTTALGWATEDMRATIRQVMKRTMRYEGILVTGNSSLLTLHE